MSINVSSNFYIIAHRGASGLFPENTLLAMEEAALVGADAIEFDVQLCKSGELVVFHDENIKRIVGTEGLISNRTLDELRSFDVGRGQKIPTFDELLELVCGKFKFLNVELKGVGTGVYVAEKIKELVQTSKWDYKDFLVTSFKWNEIVELLSVDQNIPVGVLVKEDGVNWKRFSEKVNASVLVINKSLATKEIVSEANSMGLKVFCYTVNGLEECKKLLTSGVVGIITDYPESMLKLKLEI